jgi:hypothetical protein
VSANTIASPLCLYSAPCARAGRAVYGPDQSFADCVNRTITCQTCGATGEESVSREGSGRKPYRDLKLNKLPSEA